MFEKMGEKKFRAEQMMKWLYRHRVRDFEFMTDISIPLRAKLARDYSIGRLEIADILESKDKTAKFLFKLEDDYNIESVRIPTEERETACISSQVGCLLGCRFCATASMGFKRNLSSNEIIGQFIGMEESLETSFSNVVFMGMGEPMLNLDEVIKAIEILIDDCAIGLGHRKIVVSTVGIPEKIETLRKTELKPRLAISLNAPNEKIRKSLMPKASAIASIDNILNSASEYSIHTARWFTIEYVLIKSVNDSIEQAMELSRLIKDRPCKVNLIRHNRIENCPFNAPSQETAIEFMSTLLSEGITATIRESRGEADSAACGQLATKV